MVNPDKGDSNSPPPLFKLRRLMAKVEVRDAMDDFMAQKLARTEAADRVAALEAAPLAMKATAPDAASDAKRLEELDRKLEARLKELSEVHGI